MVDKLDHGDKIYGVILKEILNEPIGCIGCTPPLHPTEIQHSPEDVIEIIRSLSITESPVTLFPDVTLREVPDNYNVGKNETAQKALLDTTDPVGNSHPAIRFENVSSPVQMQQVEYFPFSLRCAFCDLDLSSPSSFAEHVLEVHSGYPASQIGTVQQQTSDQCSPTIVKKVSARSSPSDSEKESPCFECEKCKEKNNTWKVRINAHGLPVANLTPAVPRTPKARTIQFHTPRHDDTYQSGEEAFNSDASKPKSVKRITPCVANLVEVDAHDSGACQAQIPSGDLPLDLSQRELRVRCPKCTFVAPSTPELEMHCRENHSPVLSTPYEVEMPVTPEQDASTSSRPPTPKAPCLTLVEYCQNCPICGTKLIKIFIRTGIKVSDYL
ncbi:hypothetical protein AVEN_124475-1 [Araneus ventricosus]|uniref:C2H2-type domain-containing protein n=1 Tax=Araneus ventricosus TaxID=182803 RepID=A0A4Y2KR55_ARAVE|nr:hypothetical protein AVEN_124475-1 [Araneus ventricosus]